MLAALLKSTPSTSADILPGPLALPHSAPNVADTLVRCLEHIGVEYVFGVPGGAIEPLVSALTRRQQNGRLQLIFARHEAAAACMADGYYRESGRLGVCFAATGPSTTNLLTGVAAAYLDATPMLVLTAQTPMSTFGQDALQESSCTGIDTLSMFKSITHYNTLVSHPQQLQYKLSKALMLAMNEPKGPVHLSIPVDVMKHPLNAAMPRMTVAPLQAPTIPAAQLEALYPFLLQEDTVILIGDRCRESVGVILELAYHLGRKVITTVAGKGLVSPLHPCFVGVLGFAGHTAAHDLILRAATVVAIGADYGESVIASAQERRLLIEKTVQLDVATYYLARMPGARLQMQGNLRELFTLLLSRSTPHKLSVLAKIAPAQNTEPVRQAEDMEQTNATEAVHPQTLMRAIGNSCPPSTRYVCDMGNVIRWAIHDLNPPERRIFGDRNSHGGYFRASWGSFGLATSLGMAIGTALANRRVPVMCLIGDEGYLMTGHELSLAIEHDLNIVVVILNNSRATSAAYQWSSIDYAAMARVMGAEGITIADHQELAATDWRRLTDRIGPVVVDVKISHDVKTELGRRRIPCMYA